MTILFIILLVLAGVLYFATNATALSLHKSDPAGNGLAMVFGVFFAIGLWILLIALLLVAGSRGQIAAWEILAAILLVPASGAATLRAIHMLSRNDKGLKKWPIVAPLFAPLLLILFSLAAYFPSMSRYIAPARAGAITWGGLLILSIAPWLGKLRRR